MKTVFITIFDVFQLKNFFYTDFYGTIKDKIKIVVICSKTPNKFNFIKSIFQDNANVSVEGVNIKMKVNRFQKLFLSAKLAALNTRSGNSFFTQRARVEGKWKKYIFFKFFNIFFSNSLGHSILKWLDDIILPPGESQYLFDKYKPDLVFSTNVISPIDVRLLKDAKKNKVKSISNIKSWDTATMKGYVVVNSDKLIVYNDIQKREMIKYQQVPEEKLVVLGNPGFDIYFNDKGLMTKEDFCKFAGLDPNKKIIFINISAKVINQFPEDPIANIDRWISEGKIKQPAQILINPRSKYGFSEDILKNSKNIVVHTTADKLEGGAKENYKFDEVEIYDLKNSLYHTDAVITTASTLAIEAALVDTPSISLGFDFRPVNYWLSAAVRNIDEHFWNVRQTGGVIVANNEQELIDFINAYLENPQLHKQERLAVAKLQAQFLDDKSGKRIGEFLLNSID